MPVLGPGGQPTINICDLSSEVLIKVENRTTDSARACQWLIESVLELSSNSEFRDEFVELEKLGPTFNLTKGVQEYSEANIVPVGDVNLATLDIFIWLDPPNNTNRRKLRGGNYQETDQFVNTSSGLGLPSRWYRFGNSIGFYLPPDKAYQIQARVLRMHPINDQAPQLTPLLLPRDWRDVIVLCAVERGFVELEEYDKAAKIHTILHGDPKHPERVGLISSRKKVREREAWRDSSSLRPIVRPYSMFRR